MSKDPAVLLYTSDFLTGTILMTDEQVGKYIRLLCIQHQKGQLSENDMLKICGSYDNDVFDKFEKTKDGKYYNKRMQQEAEKRRAYSESRRKNRTLKTKKPKKDMKNISKTYVNHMENENEIENIIRKYNELCEKSFTVTPDRRNKISTLLKKGFEIKDFEDVIIFKRKEWRDSDMKKHLVPETLFAPSHFENYLDQARNKPTNNSPSWM